MDRVERLRRRERYRLSRSTETPEEREARLARRREYDRARRVHEEIMIDREDRLLRRRQQDRLRIRRSYINNLRIPNKAHFTNTWTDAV